MGSMVASALSLLALFWFTLFAGSWGRNLPAFEVRTIWVQWRYTAAEWDAFVSAEWRTTVQVAIVVLVGATLLIAVGGVANGEWADLAAFAGIGFGLGSAIALFLLASGLYARFRRRRHPAEVDIGLYHVRMQQEITNWRTSGIVLKGVSVQNGRLVFSVRRPGSKSDTTVDVPIPESQHGSAEALVKRFNEELPKDPD